MAAPASEDQWRRRWPRENDDPDDDDQPRVMEEGEILPGCHSDTTDTEEYYNRHSPSACDDDEAVSGRRAAPDVVVMPADTSCNAAASPSSVARGWGGTGKRGRSARVVSPPSAEPDHQFMTAVPTVFCRRRPCPRRPAQEPISCRQNPDGYTCPKCGMWFATHQGLGGHSVGHKHRERETELMLAVVPGRRDDDTKRRERVHVCGDCGAEFATGVQLGGHKRKHWTGAPIVPKKKPRAVVQPLPPPAGTARAADLVLPLPVTIRTEEPAVGTTSQPATATRALMPDKIRLFGFDIVPGVQTAQAQQGSPASATESSPAGSSSHSQ